MLFVNFDHGSCYQPTQIGNETRHKLDLLAMNNKMKAASVCNVFVQRFYELLKNSLAWQLVHSKCPWSNELFDILHLLHCLPSVSMGGVMSTVTMTTNLKNRTSGGLLRCGTYPSGF